MRQLGVTWDTTVTRRTHSKRFAARRRITRFLSSSLALIAASAGAEFVASGAYVYQEVLPTMLIRIHVDEASADYYGAHERLATGRSDEY